MKLTYVAALIAVVGLSGIGNAAPASNTDESALTLDLDEAIGATYFIKCENGKNLLNCKDMSIWEETNDHSGLQSAIMKIGSVRFDPDHLLLG